MLPVTASGSATGSLITVALLGALQLLTNHSMIDLPINIRVVCTELIASSH